MRLCYARCSALSAQAIADEDDDIFTVRSSEGDVNWGRAKANTRLNPNISASTNKRWMRELFLERGVPMPELFSAEEVRDMVGVMEFVGRPDKHTKGRGFWLIRSERDLNRALRGTRRKRPATHFMEFVEGDREYRVHVFRGKSIRISEKEFFTNEEGRKDYITKKPGDIKLRNVRQAAKQAVAAVGLDFGAVDLLVTGDDNAEVFVLEVNAAPGLGGSMPRLYAQAFRKWAEGEWL